MTRHVMVLETVRDGDCGLDLMCRMLNAPSTPDSRFALRQELSGYLIAHAAEPWMWELMRACQELEDETVEEVSVKFQAPPQVGHDSEEPSKEDSLALANQTQLAVRAVGMCIGSNNEKIIRGVLATMAPGLIEEQIVNLRVREQSALAVQQRDSRAPLPWKQGRGVTDVYRNRICMRLASYIGGYNVRRHDVERFVERHIALALLKERAAAANVGRQEGSCRLL